MKFSQIKVLFIALVLSLCVSSALADDDINGIVTNINSKNHTITLNNNIMIKVMPNTKIEIDGQFFDSYGNFRSLKLNDFVEVEIGYYPNAYGANSQMPREFIAKSIDIQREGGRAY